MRHLTCSLFFICLLAACQSVPAASTANPSLTPTMSVELPTTAATLPLASTLTSTLPTMHTPTSFPAGPWQFVAVHNVHQNIMAAGFLTEEFGITVGTAPGVPYYTTDGGKTWNAGAMQADCRYGLDIVDTKVAWASGGAMNVRRTTDGGGNWLAVTDYGQATTKPFHTISFLDENIGWQATLYMFGATTDGGTTWMDVPQPKGLDDIASVDLVAPGKGYLLDFSGRLYSTQDNGAAWKAVSRLDLADLVIPKAAYQMAAMRFSDSKHGLIVVSEDYQIGKVKAFHTSDGGLTWTSELVPVTSGPVFLSRDEDLLTIITGPDILTVLRYNFSK